MNSNIDKNGNTEQEAVEKFRKMNYPKPSLTADIAVFAGVEGKVKLLMIKRGGHPYLGCWALPGGFADEGETIERTAARELEEETGIRDLSLQLVGIYSTPGRDPRGWIVSAAYAVFLPEGTIPAQAADDAADAGWFDIVSEEGKPAVMLPDGGRIAFDHARIIEDAFCVIRREAEAGG